MAAGMGSRFGGPKQIEPIGPNGEFIIDYSIYDAIRAGFDKIVFIIRKEHEEHFKNTIAKRVGNRIKIEYAYQELDMVPEGTKIPENRTKPWGTAHAVLCAKSLVEGPFAIINADDFYGSDSYQKVADFLRNNQNDNEGVMISYPYLATSSKFGAVNRGVIEVIDGYVEKITECSVVTDLDKNKAICTPLDKVTPAFETELTHPVSMNLFGFNQNFMNMIESDVKEFMSQDEETLLKKEVFLPDTAKKNIKNGTLKLKNIVSESLWAGLTYKEELPELQAKINNLIANQEYPTNLWN